MPKTAGRPRDAKPEETRREILRAAEESFARLGFVGATTRQVAASAGVNVATLHYHFGCKEGLYRAVMARAGGDDLPAVPDGRSREEAVRALVTALFDQAARHPALSRLSLLDVLAGPGGAAEDGARVHAAASVLGRHLPHPNGDARTAARALVALVDAALVSTSETTPDEDGLARVRDAVTAAALRLSPNGS